MYEQQFDHFTRFLGKDHSRRSMLKWMGGLAAGLFATRERTAGANAIKIEICHFTDSATNPFKVISVSEQVVEGHLAHGDRLFVDGECVGACSESCGGCESSGDCCGELQCVAGRGVCYHPLAETPVEIGCPGKS